MSLRPISGMLDRRGQRLYPAFHRISLNVYTKCITMEIDWAEAKRLRNIAKYGFDFLWADEVLLVQDQGTCFDKWGKCSQP